MEKYDTKMDKAQLHSMAEAILQNIEASNTHTHNILTESLRKIAEGTKYMCNSELEEKRKYINIQYKMAQMLAYAFTADRFWCDEKKCNKECDRTIMQDTSCIVKHFNDD